MKLRIAYRVSRSAFFLCVISAVLLILSFPNFNLSFLAWFAFVPLFFAVQNKKPSQAFFLGFITGLVFFLASIYWLIHVTLLGLILLSLYLALYFGLFALLVRNTQYPPTPRLRRAGAIRNTILVVPTIWVTLEYLRTNFATGFGWPLLGYSQYENLPIIQIADITGPYGVSFLIVMVNVVIYQLMMAMRREVEKKTKLFTIHYSLFTILLISLVLSYGHFRLTQEPTGKTLKISIIQGNILQEKKWDQTYKDFIFDRYDILTRVASTDETDLIIWPETAFPGYFGEDEELTRKLKKLVKEVKIPILFGTPLLRTTNYELRTTNSAILLDTKGDILQQYDKLHLVPFGEYVPFEKYLGFVHNLAPLPIAGFVPGSKYTIFKLPHTIGYRPYAIGQFGVLICFEDIFPSLVRQFVRQGANFMVNITNDAWFKESAAPYQHAQASVFRAVENRVNVVRSANTGLSCFINPKGKIVSRVKTKRGKDIFVEGYDTHAVEIADSNSFYTRFGDIFAYICIAISLAALVTSRHRVK